MRGGAVRHHPSREGGTITVDEIQSIECDGDQADHALCWLQVAEGGDQKPQSYLCGHIQQLPNPSDRQSSLATEDGILAPSGYYRRSRYRRFDLYLRWRE